MSEYPYITLPKSPRERLFTSMNLRASNEKQTAAFREFCNKLNNEQAQQLLDLDGFTEPYKIPIWDDEVGGPAHDASRKRDRKPDRYIETQTAPRNIVEDLVLLLIGASFDMGKLTNLLFTYERLENVNKQYWRRLNEILSKIFLDLKSVGGKRIKNVVIPTDLIINQRIWKQEKEGSYKLAIDTPVKHGKMQVSTYFTMNFDSLPAEIKAKLDSFDEQVYLAASNLWLAGNEIFSASMIYSVHNTGRPGTEDIEKIDASLSKMTATQIAFDNKEENANSNYPLIKYDGSLLPMERQRCFINGKLVESAIHLFREPPCFSYARERNQISTVDRKLLISPLNKTEGNIHLSNYILRIIGAAKKGAIKNKIKFATIYDELDADTPTKKTRAKKYTIRLFEFHKENGNISSFTQEKDGITFHWKTSGEVKKN